MRPIGKLHPTQDAPVPAGTGAVIMLTAATTAHDYPAGTRFVHIDATVRTFVSLDSTSAHVPSATIAATTNSSGRIQIINTGHQSLFQIPGGSTGYSITTDSTAGIASFQFYGAP